jgi:hypothetical protein
MMDVGFDFVAGSIEEHHSGRNSKKASTKVNQGDAVEEAEGEEDFLC